MKLAVIRHILTTLTPERKRLSTHLILFGMLVATLSLAPVLGATRLQPVITSALALPVQQGMQGRNRQAVADSPFIVETYALQDQPVTPAQPVTIRNQPLPWYYSGWLWNDAPQDGYRIVNLIPEHAETRQISDLTRNFVNAMIGALISIVIGLIVAGNIAWLDMTGMTR